jgi:AcrR family transcriptional regulator
MEKNVEQKLIDAARELFYEKGFMGVSVREIAKKADVNLALLHYYFRTKDNIFKIVFDEAFTLLFSKLNKALVSDKGLFEKIEMMVASYVAVGIKYPRLPSFVMNELAVNPELMLSIIDTHKDKSILNRNFECFYAEIEDAIANKIIKNVGPNSICTDIQALSLYPFIAKNCLIYSVFSDEKAYNKMLKERVKDIANTIINSIKI